MLRFFQCLQLSTSSGFRMLATLHESSHRFLASVQSPRWGSMNARSSQVKLNPRNSLESVAQSRRTTRSSSEDCFHRWCSRCSQCFASYWPRGANASALPLTCQKLRYQRGGFGIREWRLQYQRMEAEVSAWSISNDMWNVGYHGTVLTTPRRFQERKHNQMISRMVAMNQ